MDVNISIVHTVTAGEPEDSTMEIDSAPTGVSIWSFFWKKSNKYNIKKPIKHMVRKLEL